MKQSSASSRIAVFRAQVKLRIAWCAAGLALVGLVVWLETRFDGRTEILAATAALLWLASACTQTLLLARLAGGAGLRFWRTALLAVAVLLVAVLAMEAVFWRIHFEILLESHSSAPRRPPMVALGISGVSLGVLGVGCVLGLRGFNRKLDAAVAKLAVLLSVCLVLFGACEAAYHLTSNFGRNGWEVYDSQPSREPGARYLFRGTFGARNEFATQIRNNRLGFHDIDRSMQKPEGIRRVVLLGDSYIEALQVDVQQTISQQLERQLVSSGYAVEVCAFGVSGSGPVQAVEVLEETALVVSPDLVVFAFLAANDVRNSHPDLERALEQRLHFGLNSSTAYMVMRYFRLRFSFDMLWRADRVLNGLRHFGQPKVDQLVYTSNPYDETWTEAWRRVQSAILEMRDLCQANGCEFAVVSVTTPAQLEAFASRRADLGPENDRQSATLPNGVDTGLWDYSAPDLRMEAWLESQGIPALVLSRELACLPAAVRRSMHLVHDGHWSPEGHRLAAQRLARFITEKRLLDGGLTPP